MKEPALSPEERALLAAWLKTAASAELGPERLADWLAGLSDAHGAEMVERALAQDAGLRAALRAVRAAEHDPVSQEELARALALRPRHAAGSRARFSLWWWPLSAAAVFAAAASVGWMLGLAVGGHMLSTAAGSALDLFGAGTSL